MSLNLPEFSDTLSTGFALSSEASIAKLRMADVIAVTHDLFGVAPEVELSHDPEEPDRPFVVVTVRCAGDTRELIQRRLQWHERISGLGPDDAGSLRLSIVPVQWMPANF